MVISKGSAGKWMIDYNMFFNSLSQSMSQSDSLTFTYMKCVDSASTYTIPMVSFVTKSIKMWAFVFNRI